MTMKLRKVSTSNSKDPCAKTKISVPKCQVEIRRWKQGCYTLLNDAKSNNDKFFLDGRLFFSAKIGIWSMVDLQATLPKMRMKNC